jgi:hypothetical protein
LQKKLKNLKKFRELSEKVVIGPICRRVAWLNNLFFTHPSFWIILNTIF